MSLTDQLRRAIGEPEADSFQLMTEQLWTLTGADLLEAGKAWERELADVPEPLRDEVLAEQRAWLVEAQTWLRKHNRSLYTRVRGYMLLGQACDWKYPWPVDNEADYDVCVAYLNKRFGRLIKSS